MNKWFKNIPAKKPWIEENAHASTIIFQQKRRHNWWMEPGIKFLDLLSRVNNALLIFGTISHMTGIKTSNEINQT